MIKCFFVKAPHVFNYHGTDLYKLHAVNGLSPALGISTYVTFVFAACQPAGASCDSSTRAYCSMIIELLGIH
jgi:hypothetical protein